MENASGRAENETLTLPHSMVLVCSSPRSVATGAPQEVCDSEPFGGMPLATPCSIGSTESRSVCGLTDPSWISHFLPATLNPDSVALILPGRSKVAEAFAIWARTSRRFHCLFMVISRGRFGLCKRCLRVQAFSGDSSANACSADLMPLPQSCQAGLPPPVVKTFPFSQFPIECSRLRARCPNVQTPFASHESRCRCSARRGLHLDRLARLEQSPS